MDAPVKVCSACGVEKPRTEYYANRRNGPNGVQARCKECQSSKVRGSRKEYHREWRAKNRDGYNAWNRDYYHQIKKHKPGELERCAEYSRWYRRLKKYGITEEGYYAHLMKQDGKCAICGDVQGMELRVDHDHSTGAVRALLCAGCNAGIGMFKEDPFAMQKAIEYVVKHGNSSG